MSKVQRTTVGGISIVAVQDTWWMNPAAPMFHTDPPVDLSSYSHLLDADGRFELSVHSYVLDSQGTRILVDTGWADLELPGVELAETPSLPATMERAGIALDSIDIVIHTHLHADHIGWNTRPEDGALVPTFPNALHLIQSAEWAFWIDGSPPEEAWTPPDYDRHLKPLEERGMVQFLDADGFAVTDEISTIGARGHTPGHTALRIESEGRIAYIMGDACHLAVEVCQPLLRSITDVDPNAAAETRDRLLRQADDEGALLLAGHFPFPGVGRRVNSGNRYDYQPVA